MKQNNTAGKATFIKQVRELGGDAAYSGTWPATLYVKGKDAERIVDQLYRIYGRHKPVRFMVQPSTSL